MEYLLTFIFYETDLLILSNESNEQKIIIIYFLMALFTLDM